MSFSHLIHKSLYIPNYFVSPVLIEDVAEEDDYLYLRVRTDSGELGECWLTLDEVQQGIVEQQNADRVSIAASEQALYIESERIRLAYAHDPHFAVSLSGVVPLPHQLEAVYERMLPQVRLRFLLADDPGAGKTIMAGLLMKELKMRGAVERILVLCPAPLTIQWQDEMHSKFDEVFEIIRSEVAKDQLAGNAWERFPQCIASIDFAKQDDVAPELLRADWDLVIIDEAHKCAARWFSGEIKRTKRYILAEALSQQAERLVLLTATPHNGDVEQFAYFLRLLDSDQFVGPDRLQDFAHLNQQALIPFSGQTPSPWFLRRTKEELRDFNGEKLFTQRNAVTVPFELSEAELSLYAAVTDYINRYLPKQTGRKKAPVALARTVLQRRLASSIRAISLSLQRRYERFETTLREVESLPANRQENYLRMQNLLEGYDDEQEADDADDMLSEAAATTITAAERIVDLRNEVYALKELVGQAQRVEKMDTERKLEALLQCLQRAEFQDLKDGRGKLLIFTEHRDTLNYLRERLEKNYHCVEIHGGMNAKQRKAAQDEFRTSAQVCLATDAAGEGINLQFCHLMINYDIPWNPMRLEQRMGRIHRIGQKLDVFIFNFVAANTIEGRVLHRLLEKLDMIRSTLGDRVFDVIGLMLRVNGVDLEEILREAAYNPRHITDEYYVQQIERISAERLRELEEATGVAMATSHVDLGHIQAQDYRSEERRLMPEYVELFFLEAAKIIGLRIEQRADRLYRIEHVPQRLRAPTLNSVKRFGPPATEYRKFTFNKDDILYNSHHVNAELISPGHPLFAAVSEELDNQLRDLRAATARYHDPLTMEPYHLHFFVSELVGEEPNGSSYRTYTQYAALTVILENSDGSYEIVPPDILHDLDPTEGATAPIAPADRQAVERYIQRQVLRHMLDEQRQAREREITIRREYLTQTFTAHIQAMQRKALELDDRVHSGQTQYRIARDEAYRRVDELEARRDQKLKSLDHLRVLRPGALRYLGSAWVTPPDSTPIPDMHSDPEVEDRAMAYVMAYERERGWEPVDVSRLHDGSGFDIRSIGPVQADGSREMRRIEVKGRSGYDQPVVLTTNEWLQAQRHGDGYWLYVVWGCGRGQTPQLLDPIQNPARKLKANPIIKHYVISANDLKDEV